MEDSKYTHLVIVFLLTIIAGNLLFLDLKVFSPNSVMLNSTFQLSQVSIPTTAIPTIVNGQESARDFSCPQNCLSIIEQTTKSSNIVAGSPSQLTTYNSQLTTSHVTHESYIPLGSGSTSKSVFDDITATETIIDTSNYGKIKEAYFIVSLKNPTRNGSVEAQFYNVTDKHPVWNSLVSMNGQESQTITSGKITLDIGNKLYRVQLKSTLSYTVSLENAKIRIISE